LIDAVEKPIVDNFTLFDGVKNSRSCASFDLCKPPVVGDDEVVKIKLDE
jgi:hypothetical protein